MRFRIYDLRIPKNCGSVRREVRILVGRMPLFQSRRISVFWACKSCCRTAGKTDGLSIASWLCLEWSTGNRFEPWHASMTQRPSFLLRAAIRAGHPHICVLPLRRFDSSVLRDRLSALHVLPLLHRREIYEGFFELGFWRLITSS